MFPIKAVAISASKVSCHEKSRNCGLTDDGGELNLVHIEPGERAVISASSKPQGTYSIRQKNSADISGARHEAPVVTGHYYHRLSQQTAMTASAATGEAGLLFLSL